MLSFFRKGLSSWFAVALLAFVAGAVVITGVGTPNGLGGGAIAGSGDALASLKGVTIGSDEVRRRAELEVQAAREQNPQATMQAYVASGGIDRTVSQLVSSRALERWARDRGITASDRLIDGEIASIPAFRGPTGQFDAQAMRAVLQSRRITERQMRDDIAGDLIRRQLLGAVAGGAKASNALVTPYAALLLEQRFGLAGLVPVAQDPGPAPTDTELKAFYAGNLARYTLPERRVLRYAAIAAAQAVPTEAEIAAAYRQNAAIYAAGERRSFSQIVLPTEAAARAASVKLAAGQPFAQVAQAAGFSPVDTGIGVQTRQQLAELATPAAAAAAYALPADGTTAPQRSPLGWHLIHLDRIEAIPARTLDQVRGEIAASLAKQRSADAESDREAQIQAAVDDGGTFDEVVAANKLTATTTPPVTAAGTSPGPQPYAFPAELQPLLRTAFDAAVDDEATVESLGEGKGAVLLDVAQVLPAAPVPFAEARPRVVADFTAKRAQDRARATARRIVAQANKGVALPRAFAEAGLPAPRAIGGRQIELAQQQGGLSAPLQKLFTMGRGRTDLVPADGGGFLVVRLDRIVPGDAAQAPQLVASTRREFDQVLAEEYVEQFVNAIGAKLDVKRDAAAIARFKASLAGGAQ